MSDMTLNKPGALTMADRVARSLAKRNTGNVAAINQQAPQPKAAPKALLLDVSGSMYGNTETPGVNRITALRKLVADMNLAATQDVYLFSTSVTRCDGLRTIPEPYGGTDLTRAFRKLKEDGHRAVVLITDGEPNDKETALEEAQALSLDILYVGGTRQPPFLTKLAKACKGSARTVDLASDKRLAATVRGLLA